MYQYADTDKSQSKKSKASDPITSKGHIQTGIETPVQTKSFFNPSFDMENSIKKSSFDYASRPAQLMPLTSSPLQMQSIPEKERLTPNPIKPNNTGIPTPMKSRFEALSGFSFDDVKVHYNSDKPAQLQALAYTQGNQVHIAQGQEKHLEHELGHVVQQKQGRVSPTVSINNVWVNDEEDLEREADTNGESQHYAESIDLRRAMPRHVTQRKITMAGAEIEAKHIKIFEENGDSIPKQTQLVPKPTLIVADTGNLEYVSDPINNTDTFFKTIERGRQKLCAIIQTANQAIFKSTDKETGLINLENQNYSVKKGRQKKAKPQLTVQISKGGLDDFAGLLSNASKRARVPKRTKVPVEGYGGIPIFAEKIETMVNKGFDAINTGSESKPAKGLAKMVWQTISCAYYDTSAPYYKAKFAIMSRTSFVDLYDKLSEEHKAEYKTISNRLYLDFVYGFNRVWSTMYNFGVWNPKISGHETSASMQDALLSVYDEAKRMKKTFPQLERLDKQVEVMASDKMATTGDVGASVGAYNLPDNSDGVYEIRGMPLIDIDDARILHKVYYSYLKYYSGNALGPTLIDP